jgi:peptidoglycan/LPS O-acetylase OafA/YrhL
MVRQTAQLSRPGWKRRSAADCHGGGVLASEQTTGGLNYQPRLDGVRAVAVAFVLQAHFAPYRGLSLGSAGVEMFFVLSGYLISRIIFDYKRRGLSIASAAARFYWRRFLRLTPPLYLAIGVTALLGIGNMREDWLWHASYLTNFKVYIDGAWGPATHFWTLAVEEQFYLVWFFLLIATPLRYAFALIIAGISIGILYIYIPGSGWAFVLLPGAIFYFCLGGFIAHTECFNQKLDLSMRARFANKPVLALALGAALLASPPFEIGRGLASPVATGFSSFCLIVAARNGAQGDFLWWLSYRIVRHIGRISYGIYVYHFFVPQFLAKVGIALNQSISGKILVLVLETAITLIVSELSWRIMEQPISKLRSLIPGRTPSPQTPNFLTPRRRPSRHGDLPV